VEQQDRHALQVVIASGPEALGRAVLGFAFAVCAAISGVKVTVILALSGVAWAADQEPAAKQPVNGFDSISNYTDMLRDHGATVRLCSACLSESCAMTTEKNDPAQLPCVGLTEVAIQAGYGPVQTVIF
jgi:predicted peroxiredoxin